jgi:hypothetical protein
MALESADKYPYPERGSNQRSYASVIERASVTRNFNAVVAFVTFARHPVTGHVMPEKSR